MKTVYFLVLAMLCYGCSKEHPYPKYLNMTCYSYLNQIKVSMRYYRENHNREYPKLLKDLEINDLIKCPVAVEKKLKITEFLYIRPNEKSKQSDPLVYTPFPSYVDKSGDKGKYYVLRRNGKIELIDQNKFDQELQELHKRQQMSN